MVGGAETCGEVCEEYGFTRYITVQEMAGVFPVLVPLSSKAGYPTKGEGELMADRVSRRFGVAEVGEILNEYRCRAVFMMSNPYMWETHMQIVSDIVISKDGKIGTVRGPGDP